MDKGHLLSHTVQSLLILFSFSTSNAASLPSFGHPSHRRTVVANQHFCTGSLHFSEVPGQCQNRKPIEGLLLRDGLSLLGAGPGNEMHGGDLESPCLGYP